MTLSDRLHLQADKIADQAARARQERQAKRQRILEARAFVARTEAMRLKARSSTTNQRRTA